MKDGIDLAIEEINAKDGVNGRKIQVLYEDDKGDPKIAVSALEKLITVDRVSFVIGPETSSGVLAAAPITERNKVILLSAGTASPKISEAGDFIFRIYPTSIHEAHHLLLLTKKMGFRKAAILFVNNDYGVGIEQIMVKELPNAGITVLVNEGYDITRKDFRALILKAKAVGPDVTFLLGYPEDIALILRQAKELDLRSSFVAPSTFDAPIILPIAGDAAEGVIFVYAELPNNEVFQRFASSFKAKFKNEPNIYNGLGYDAAKVLGEAIRIGGTDTEKVRDALYNTKDFPGVTGKMTFDRNGDVVERPMMVQVIRGGKAVVLGER